MSFKSADLCLSSIQNSFSGCADFNSRRITFCDDKTGYLLNIGSYTDRDYISESIVLPLIKNKRAPKDSIEVFGLISSTELTEITDVTTAITKLLSGFAVIILELYDGVHIYCAQVRMVAARSVAEPDSEVVIKGPREGFIENSEDNLALLRKRLKTTSFKALRLTGGVFTDTTVYICYIKGVANDETVKRVKSKFESINQPGIIDSGYFEHYLQKKTPSLFPNVGNSEKPDVVAAKLLEGRIAIICDGSPVVLTVPYLFIESIQSAEDYLKTPYYATFMRALRFLSVMIALYLPAVYLSTIEHHTSALPYKLYKAVIELRRDVPFGVFGELITILLIFEIIREVGIRMPKAVGNAVGIVAGLTLGDAAISANLASAPVIMVSSIAAVCTFITPAFMNSISLIRIINLILAQYLGFPGIILSACFITACMARKESFGVPYLLPLSPIKPKGLCDTVISIPKQALNHTSDSLYDHGENNQ
ncbi:MAG: spore germination protein [Ruminococcaceae bacterium]|nr:spore germination protein [Oscillospiraceae bacterium]